MTHFPWYYYVGIGIGILLAIFLIYWVYEEIRVSRYRARRRKKKEDEELREGWNDIKESLGRVAEAWDNTSSDEKKKVYGTAKKLVRHAANSTSVRDFVKKVTDEPETNKTESLPPPPPESGKYSDW